MYKLKMKDFRLQSYLTISFQKRIICKYICPNGRLKLFFLLYSGGHEDINILTVNSKQEAPLEMRQGEPYIYIYIYSVSC